VQISTDPATPNWILVHDQRVYGPDEEYANPQEELEDHFDPTGKYFEPSVTWHWSFGKSRLKEDGRPRRILLAWDQFVFGEATATVTRRIEPETRTKNRFAFILLEYKRRKSIRLDELPLGPRAKHHRGLIKLDAKILAAYDRLLR
jgi:hypothetical protein